MRNLSRRIRCFRRMERITVINSIIPIHSLSRDGYRKIIGTKTQNLPLMEHKTFLNVQAHIKPLFKDIKNI